MKKIYLIFVACLFMSIGMLTSINTNAQTLSSPYTVTTFPTTLTNISSAGGETAAGMSGSCYTLPCCSVNVIKVTLPADGVLRVEMNGWTPLGGSIIAYRSLVATPTSYADLAYISGSPGNFCGFRDTLLLGRAYGDWDSTPYGQVPTYVTGLTTLHDFNNPGNQSGYYPAGDYYLLMFNESQQTGQGAGTTVDLSFEFAEACESLTVPASVQFDTLEPNAELDTLSFYVKNERTLGVFIDTTTGTNLTGIDSAQFSILTPPINYLAIGDSSLVEVLFAPTSSGDKTATLEITFSDLNCSATSSIALNGSGAEPEIVVLGNTTNINNNDASPATSDLTDMGTLITNTGLLTQTYQITNTGSDTLEFTNNPIVTLSGNSQFVISSQPAATVLPGDTTSFSITFTPTVDGTVTTNVSIVSNDVDESTFTFSIQATAAERNGLNFDGSNDYVTINGVADEMDGITGWTLESWINASSSQSGNDQIIGVNTTGSGNIMLFRLDDGHLEVYDGSDSHEVGPDLRDDTWHHVAATYSNDTVTFYIDGNIEGIVDAASISFTSSHRWSLGQEYDGSSSTSDFFRGSLNEVRIWKTVRTPQEIADGIYCEIQNPTGYTDLVGYYTFNHGESNGTNTGITTAIDYSGYGNDGTLNKFALTGTTSNFVSATNVGVNCTSVSVTVCDANSYTVSGGNTYSASGLYLDTLNNSIGGDSIVYTNLTISYSEESQDIIIDTTVCDSLIIPAQTEYTPFATFENNNDNWIEINGAVDSLINTNRSVFLWMREADQVNSNQDILVGINTSGTSTVTNFGINTNEQLYIYDGGNTRNSGVVVTDGQWHFVGYTYDEATNFTQFWVDGVAANSFSNGQSISSGNRISLGQEFDGSSTGNFYDGDMAEVTIWNEVLDSADIASIMQASVQPSHPKYSHLKAYYPMIKECGSSGFTVKDYGPHGYDGTASSNSIIITDSLSAIPNHNAAPLYTKSWAMGGSPIASSDTLSIIGQIQEGNYTMDLSLPHFNVSDAWNVTLVPACAGPSVSIALDASISCNGFADGGATAIGANGTSPYTYVWSNGATTASIAGVNAGTYYVTLTDDIGDTTTDSVTITEPSAIMAALSDDTVNICTGQTSDGVSVAANGGTAPYTYLWSNGSTDTALVGLTGGAYTVTITDANGCTTAVTHNVIEVALPSANIIQGDSTAYSIGDSVQLSVNSVVGTSYDWYQIASNPTWETVGSAKFTSSSALYTSIATATDGTIYIAFQDDANSDKGTVMSYDGSNWNAVGSAGFTSTAIQGNTTDLAFSPNGELYFAYRSSTFQANVMKFDGTSWTLVGGADFRSCDYVSLAFSSNGTPHVGMKDNGSGGKASVYTFDGTSWTALGSAGISAGTSQYNSVAIAADDTPYIGYRDGTNSNKATVMKYDGSNWVTVGSAGFSAGGTKYNDLEIATDGTVYFAFQDDGVSNKATVMQFDGTNWTTVGGTAPSAGTAYWTSLTLNENDQPVLAYSDAAISPNKVTVNTFDGSNWQITGNAKFSPDVPVYIDLETHQSNLYVGYSTSGNGKATVMNFSGDQFVASGASIYASEMSNYFVQATNSTGCTNYDTIYVDTMPPCIDAFDSIYLEMLSASCDTCTDGGATVQITNGTSIFSYLWNNGATTASVTGLTPGIYTLTVTDSVGCKSYLSGEVFDESTFFVTTWKTDNSGASNSTSVLIPTNSSYTYNYDIDWDGDGVFDEFGVTGDATHDYGTAGTYTVKIKGSFPHLNFYQASSSVATDTDKLLSIENWGTNSWRSMNGSFMRCTNLSINATDAPDLSLVTDASYLFYQATTFNDSIGHWDVSNITQMRYMFYDAEAFNQDISTWNVSNVVNMSYMFRDALVFNQDIGSWDVSKVVTLYQMFYNAEAFNQDISSWDVGAVTTMHSMFRFADVFNQNIGGWDVSKVTDMQAMFANAPAFNQDISTWDVDTVTKMNGMFASATSFNQNIGGWDVSAVTAMHDMFSNASAFNQDISSWDVSNVTTMYSMFSNASIFNQNIGGWDVSSVNNMNRMFFNADAFDQDISTWDVDTVTNMSYMFYGADVFNQNIGGWDVSAVTNMSYMFSYAAAFDQNIGNWSVDSVTTMRSMFSHADVFNQDISNWNVSNVTDFRNIFQGTDLFNQDIGGWDVSGASSMSHVFASAIAFDQNIGNWDVSNVTDFLNMFAGVTLSVDNYDSLLIGWEAQSLQSGQTFYLSNSNYCAGDTARQNIISNYGWIIFDAGQACPLNLTTSQTDITCNGAADGTATATVTDGVAPYSYLWSNGSVNTTIGNLSAGTYTVTITDNNNIDYIDSVTITEPTAISSTTTVDANVSCNGSLDGGATVVATGGTSPNTYQWSSGASNTSISNVGAGTYFVTITDSNMCTAVDSVTITEPAAVGVSNVIINPDCGISNGNVDITVSGTNTPYSFVWSNGFTGEDISSVPSGTYTVSITDNMGCTGSFTYNVNNAGSLTANAATTDVGCYDDHTGSIDLTVSGGTTPYAYAWSNGQTVEDLSNEPAGVYTVTVTDGIGCLYILTDTITEPDQLMGDITAFATAITPVSCPGGNDGAIDLPIIGGTTPYTYLWNTGATTQTVTGLTAGTYSVVVTDANGCTVGGPLSVTELSPMVAKINTVIDATDYNTADGSLNVTVTGGSAPFTYNWSNGATTDNITGLAAAPYTVLVTDDNGCTVDNYGYVDVLPSACATQLDWETLGADEALTLDSYNAKGITVSLTKAEFGGAGNDDNFSFEHGQRGSIDTVGFIQFDLDASSNNDPNQYSRMEIDFSSPIRNLNFDVTDIDGSGTYADSAMIAAYDINGNLVTGYFSFVGDSIDFNYSSDTLRMVGIGESANTETYGNAGIVFPDTLSKLVIWHYTSQTGSTDPGDHRVYLSALRFENDYQGVYDDYVSVTENDSILIDVLENDDLSCYTPQTTSIITSPTNGTASLMGDTINYVPTEKFFGIDSLQYNVCDNNGQCDTAWTYISVLPQLVDSLSWALNNNDGDVAIDSQLVYQNRVDFIFNDPANIDDGDLFEIESGTTRGLFQPTSYLKFDINADDVAAANEYVEVEMDFEAAVKGLHFNMIDIDNSSSGGGVDSVVVTAFNQHGNEVPVFFYDMGDYTTSFKNGNARIFYGINESSSTSEGFANVGVFVPDSVQKVVIHYNPPITSDGDENPASQTSYIANLYWKQALPVMDVYNAGTLIANQDTTPSTSDSTDFGNVFLGDSLLVTYTISNTGNDTLKLTNPVSVTGGADFSIVSVSTDTVLPGATADVVVKFEPITAGVQNATLSIDNNDPCVSNYSFDITANAACPSYSAQAILDNNATCYGIANGGATASVNGGTAPYSYVWSNGATNATITSVMAGNYSVTITDAFGCFDSASVTITEPTQLTTSTVVDSNVVCNGLANGGITTTPSGGTAPYSYVWSNGATNASITGVAAGTYTVSITDNNGCTSTSSATITEPTVLALSTIVDSNISCNGLLDGGASATVTGGTAPYTYTWDASTGSAATASITGVAAGTYSITVTDNNGCTIIDSASITEPASLIAVIVADSNATCNGYLDAGASASASGGTPPYSYSWSNTAITASITGVAAGTYTVTITDDNGCTSTSSVSLTEPTPLVATAIVDSNISCNGLSDGGASASATGGTPPYSYTWNNAATTTSITGVAAGTYTVTITDNNGCTSTSSATITEPTVLSVNISVDNNESCTGASNGSLTAQVTGGTISYSYAWSNGSTTGTANSLPAGNYTVTVTDANGCTATDTDVIIIQDVTSPTVVPYQNIITYLDVNGQVSITAAMVDSLSSDACGIDTMSLDVYDFTCNEVGNQTVKLYVTDINGNLDSATTIVTILDTITPTVSTQNITVYLDSNGMVNIAASDIDNGSTDNCSIDTLTLDSTSFDCSEVGGNTVILTVTDVNGNSDTASATVTVVDTISPTVWTQNITVYLDATGTASITATDIDSASIDNCSIATLALDSTQFDCSEIGNNTVKLWATDVNGNIDSAYATVTVLDTIAPSVATQNITVYLDANGTTSIVPADIDNNSFDACGIDTMYIDSANFDCAEVGNNTVMLTVVDGYGNQDTASAIVTVLDTVTPTVITQNFTAYLDNTGNVSILADSINNGSYDNCTVDTFYLNSTQFDCSEVGANTVTLSVVDVNGNIDSAFATVTILDTLAPTAITQSIDVYLDANGSATITAAMIDNNSIDNCTIDTITIDSTHFDCSETGANTVQLTVTDIYGNNASASATVTVHDTIAPALVLIADTSICAVDTTGAVFNYSISSTDNCTPDSIVQLAGLPSGSTFPIGTTINVFEAIDASGNTYVDSFAIEVYSFPTLSIDSIGILCETDAILTLNAIPLGGSFSGDGVSGNQFDPTAVNTGVTTITYTYSTPQGCEYFTEAYVQVRENPSVMLGSFADTICIEQAVVACPVGTPSGGVYTGTGIDSIVLITGDAGIGEHYITYTYTDKYGCTSADSSIANIVKCLEGVGIDNPEDAAFGLMVYPNPNNGRFTIEHTETTPVQIIVYAADGRLVSVMEMTDQKQEISLEQEAQGIYTIQIIGEHIHEQKQIIVY